jgi:myo-inositol-1(or 4)-monophosphatase
MKEYASFPYDQARDVAVNLARVAGSRCLELQQSLGTIKYKTPRDVVTVADLESERLVVAGLQSAFPAHGIRTEEAGWIEGCDSRYVWIIDPVDGTVNFSRGIPLWGISIALMEDQKPVVSVVFLPALGELFTAVKGQGTFLNEVPVRVSATDSLEKAIVSNGDFNVGDWARINAQNLHNFGREAEFCTRVKCLGSAVVEGTFVAAGRLDVFVMTMSYPWDIAGIALLITEAGGKVTDLQGHGLRFIDGEQALFSNGILHSRALSMLQ